jgi:hypothetical protein
MVQRFELGQIVATPGALELLGELEVSPSALLERHASGDWGEVDAHDRRENEQSVRRGFRVLSSYSLGDEDGGAGAKVWIITEADRSSTCILLPSEY